jgi:hypothetical protein
MVELAVPPVVACRLAGWRARSTLAIVVAAMLASPVSGCASSSRARAAQTRASPPVASAAPAASSAPAADPPSPLPVAKAASPKPELPRGGRSIFPAYRLVGFCGTPGAPALGELQGNLGAKTKALLQHAGKYGEDRTVLPVFELIAVVVQAGAGSDGKYRRRVDSSVVDAYLRAAREANGLLLLNIQPGQSDFVTEVKHFEKYLAEPDVGVALDPEWAMKAGQKPGRIYGQTTATEINEVGRYLSKIVADHDLPEKVLIFHQVNKYVVKDEAALEPQPGVVLVKSVDGLGPKHTKIETYRALVSSMSPNVHAGFKLFFEEDRRNGGFLMTPKEVLSLKPTPEYVMYE